MSFLRNCASNFFMTGEELLEQLLGSFQSSYDIERKRRMGGEIFDAYASFRAASAKYVLVERAELWRAECFEHMLFCVAQTELTPEDIERFRHTSLRLCAIRDSPSAKSLPVPWDRRQRSCLSYFPI